MSARTPTVAGKQLSSSLKERLKKCGRYHSSPKGMTPQTRPSQNRQLSCQLTEKDALRSETPAKRPCLENSTEVRKPQTESMDLSSVSVQGQNSESDIVSGSDIGNFSKAGSPLLELKNKTELIQLKSFSDVCVNVSVPQSWSSGTENLMPSTDEKNSGSAMRDEKSDKYSNDDIFENHSSSSKTCSTAATRSGLGAKSTPVSSRSCSRTYMVRANRLDFDGQSEKSPSEAEYLLKPSVTSKSEVCPTATVLNDHCQDNRDTSVPKTPESGMVRVLQGNNGDNDKLLKEISEKEEILRKLKMVKMYRTKNNLTELEVLIEKWRTVAQQGLLDLNDALPEPKPSLTELLQHLGVDNSLVKFDPVEEIFT